MIKQVSRNCLKLFICPVHWVKTIELGSISNFLKQATVPSCGPVDKGHPEFSFWPTVSKCQVSQGPMEQTMTHSTHSPSLGKTQLLRAPGWAEQVLQTQEAKDSPGQNLPDSAPICLPQATWSAPHISPRSTLGPLLPGPEHSPTQMPCICSLGTDTSWLSMYH